MNNEAIEGGMVVAELFHQGRVKLPPSASSAQRNALGAMVRQGWASVAMVDGCMIYTLTRATMNAMVDAHRKVAAGG